jgi:uncharacterized membrane protein YphA (DoxX/SURF4 family)
MTWRRRIVFLLRLALGGIFIYASLDKIVHPHAFAEIIYNYRILPGELINIAAVFLPWLELLMGLLLISGRFMHGATSICALLLIAFWASLLFNMARGLDIQCGCFSTQSTDAAPMIWYVVRDTTFLAMGLYLFYLTMKPKRENSKR